MTSVEDRKIADTLADLNRLIAERVEAERQVDQLTQLGNELARKKRMEAALADGTLAWIAFAEIDKFKSINARFGYDLADVLLKRVATLLRQTAASLPGDVAVFRPHGDEFYLVSRSRSDVLPRPLVDGRARRLGDGHQARRAPCR